MSQRITRIVSHAICKTPEWLKACGRVEYETHGTLVCAPDAYSRYLKVMATQLRLHYGQIDWERVAADLFNTDREKLC